MDQRSKLVLKFEADHLSSSTGDISEVDPEEVLINFIRSSSQLSEVQNQIICEIFLYSNEIVVVEKESQEEFERWPLENVESCITLPIQPAVFPNRYNNVISITAESTIHLFNVLNMNAASIASTILREQEKMNKNPHSSIDHPELAVNFSSESQLALLDIEDTIKNIHKYDVELRKYTKRWHEGENWGKSRRKDDGKKRAAERAALAALEVGADEFVDALRKLKLAFLIVNRLRPFLKSTAYTAEQYINMLMSPLLAMVKASNQPPLSSAPFALVKSIDTPLFTRSTLKFLFSCISKTELEWWRQWGDAWNIPVEDWRGEVRPFRPEFRQANQSPYLPFLDPTLLTQKKDLSDNAIYRSIQRGPAKIADQTGVRIKKNGSIASENNLPYEFREIQELDNVIAENETESDSSSIRQTNSSNADLSENSFSHSKGNHHHPGKSGLRPHRHHISSCQTSDQESAFASSDDEGSFPIVVRRKNTAPIPQKDYLDAPNWTRPAKQNEFAASLKKVGSKCVIVLKGRDARRSGEISIYQDEILELIGAPYGPWWMVKNAVGNEGYVPKTCIEEIELKEPAANDKKPPSSSISPVNESSAPEKKNGHVPVLTVKTNGEALSTSKDHSFLLHSPNNQQPRFNEQSPQQHQQINLHVNRGTPRAPIVPPQPDLVIVEQKTTSPTHQNRQVFGAPLLAPLTKRPNNFDETRQKAASMLSVMIASRTQMIRQIEHSNSKIELPTSYEVKEVLENNQEEILAHVAVDDVPSVKSSTLEQPSISTKGQQMAPALAPRPVDKETLRENMRKVSEELNTLAATGQLNQPRSNKGAKSLKTEQGPKITEQSTPGEVRDFLLVKGFSPRVYQHFGLKTGEEIFALSSYDQFTVNGINGVESKRLYNLVQGIRAINGVKTMNRSDREEFQSKVTSRRAAIDND